MINALAPETRVFRAAFWPVFSCYLAVFLLIAILMLLAGPPLALQDFAFVLALCIFTAAVAALYIQQFCFEVLSTDGVEVCSPFGRRLLPWNNVTAIYTFGPLKVVYLRCDLVRQVLFFQRRAGEFREMVADLVPRESLVWKRLNDA